MRGKARSRCIVVGYGVRGRLWCGTAARRRDVVLAGVVDPDTGARAAAEQAGLRAWSSLADALADAAPDAAVIASPPEDHPDQAIACVREGVRVLVEKPLALSAADARRVAAEAEAAGVLGLVGQNFRFRRRELAVRAALAQVGTVRGGVVVSARPHGAMPAATEALPHAPLWDFAIHHLDLLRLRIGTPPTSVRAKCARARSTTYTLELEWEGLEPVLYRLTYGAPSYFDYEWLQAERGAVEMVGARIRVVRPGRPRGRRVWPPRGPAPRDLMLARLVGADDCPEPSLADNVQTVAMVEAAIRSLDEAGDLAHA